MGTPDFALPSLQTLIDSAHDVVGVVNEQLPRHEQIKRWAILPAEFSIATGELTPTLKLKRRVIVERWGSVIDQLYVSSE